MLLEYGRENGEILRHEVYRCATITEIADFMNDEGDRYFGWNFVILYKPSGTVEFRSRVQKRPGRDQSPWMQRMDRIHLRFAVAVVSR